jgi:hypothetical protein
MNASTQRQLIRWLHIVLSIPILGYIYGPVASIPPAANMVRLVFVPVVILSGLWMWKGHVLVRRIRQRNA